MFKVKKNSVSEILADFSSKVQELRELASRKSEESANYLVDAEQLRKKGEQANEEAWKATSAAEKIEKFLTD